MKGIPFMPLVMSGRRNRASLSLEQAVGDRVAIRTGKFGLAKISGVFRHISVSFSLVLNYLILSDIIGYTKARKAHHYFNGGLLRFRIVDGIKPAAFSS
jgi:hypothetical protein